MATLQAINNLHLCAIAIVAKETGSTPLALGIIAHLCADVAQGSQAILWAAPKARASCLSWHDTATVGGKLCL